MPQFRPWLDCFESSRFGNMGALVSKRVGAQLELDDERA
jgi:hypothetical protein